ncbi:MULTISPECIES: hypothetical protein [unclassified Ruegeria]|uniref:hypothetical protein n=1 Tax=unclassified Ruegeria TaxID=2625375 RepID=UPI001ADC8A9F|nr:MULTISPECIES: hypothetical protein [unclassified Ruegeria]MBO9413679.1 hypothetical protein [Ruegeria sp. R8_1]MBO9417714.1 hypothetical protein [Ruegeria sp. R8_2]
MSTDTDERLAAIEEKLEHLEWHRFYDDIERRRSEDRLESTETGQEKFIKSTSDGWLNVKINVATTGLPSGLSVRLSKTAQGRDYGVVAEGVLRGRAFDVTSGFLVDSYSRYSDMVLKSRLKSGGSVIVNGESYDRDVIITYRDGGASKSIGPFHSKTDPTNPPPTGTTDIEIPDFPHDLGKAYPPHGTVWFRIGHSGDFYVHAGRISEGCVTCDPATWSKVFEVMHKSRAGDGLSVGKLDFA